ncbi:MAG: hypothetical protein R2822_00650 [Spirosomataceae bacterium]
MHSLIATPYFSGFDLAHDTYNAITAASNGKIYYVLCSDSYDIGGKMYAYNPATDQTEFIADLTEVCGEKIRMPFLKARAMFDFMKTKENYISRRTSGYMR